jgi:hypothetical protein
MNIYGSAYEESKRQANERIAGKLPTENPLSAPTKTASITEEMTGNRTGERNPFPRDFDQSM